MLADSLLPFRQTAWILGLIMQGWLLTTGCAPSSQATTPRGTDIIIFIDFSASVQGRDREMLKQDLVTQIIPSLSAVARIVINAINDKSLTHFQHLDETTLPLKPDIH